jgi:hypothetical protein
VSFSANLVAENVRTSIPISYPALLPEPAPGWRDDLLNMVGLDCGAAAERIDLPP